jgi:hypothetical protein
MSLSAAKRGRGKGPARSAGRVRWWFSTNDIDGIDAEKPTSP